MTRKRPENKYTFIFPACLGIGTGIGALMHNVGMGIGIGALVGTILGLIGWQLTRMEQDQGA
jgi:hypothetical protein